MDIKFSAGFAAIHTANAIIAVSKEAFKFFVAGSIHLIRMPVANPTLSGL
jgi:hypothetical protein